MQTKPFPQSYWVREGLLCAGHYPGATNQFERDRKLAGLLDCGIRRVINLMEEHEKNRDGQAFEPYFPRLQELAAARNLRVELQRLSIEDARAPTRSQMHEILEKLSESVDQQIPTYLHCWGGHGRTSTVVACYLIRHGSSASQAVEQVKRWRAELPKSHYPFYPDQEQFVLSWSDFRQEVRPGVPGQHLASA
jgi:hypothetical protein